MNKRKKYALIASISIAFLVAALPLIEDGLSCLAYYDQCTAERVEGLTKEQCFERDDTVAFLFNGDICLVKPKQ